MSQNVHVEAVLFRHLLDHSVIPLIGSAIGGSLVGLAHMDSPYQQQVLVWLFVLYATIVIRALLTKRCRSRFKEMGYSRPEAIRYALTTGLSGFAWGMGGLFVLDASPLAMVVTITAIQAMIMGGALTLGAYLPSFYAFSLPAILPLVVALGLKGGGTNIVLALYSAIFLVLMLDISKRLNHSLRDVWKLTFEKEYLLSELTKANDHQKTLANTDGLTGIANRRRFDDVLAQELARFSRTNSPLSLLILDVDHFKTFNDAYGHVAGDECLKQIAEILKKQFNRASDMAARYGGEEFAIIMPDTDERGAIQKAEVIRSEVAKLNIQHGHSPTAGYITVSMGIVTLYNSDIREANDLIAMADECLYQAKADGRNRFVSTRLKHDVLQRPSCEDNLEEAYCDVGP